MINLIKIITERIRRMLLLVKPVVIGRFRYRYEYTSPFGEEWWVYRLWFGFIPIGYNSYRYFAYNGVENQDEVQKYVDSLNDL